MRTVVTGLIRAYRYLVSPFLPPSCRFTPSCSEYALQAVNEHGAVIGVYLSGKRLCRCHPFSHGGYDPVPGKHRSASVQQHTELTTDITHKINDNG